MTKRTLTIKTKSMNKASKSSKAEVAPTPTATAEKFAKWLRAIPQGSDGKVTIQPPISLTPAQWAVLAVDAARQEVTLDDLIQGSVNSFVGLIQEDLGKAA